MSAPLKICLAIHSLGIGGMERVMALLATNFSKRKNVEVHLLLIGRKREIVYDIPESIIIHKPSFSFNNNRRMIEAVRTIYFVRSRIKKINPDTVLSFGELWNNLILISLLGLDIPIYISDRSKPGKDIGTLHNLLRNLLYPFATGYIAQTKEAERVCLKNEWNDNIKVIGNPIRLVTENGQIERKNIVLSVGRLIKTKHFDQLIRMFAEIDNPDWKLVIAGGDAKKLELSKELGKLIRELGVDQSVFLEGEQNNIDQYYRKSKIFAFTSSSEGFPNVIGEALSAGLPVISYDCQAGPADMIYDGENGFLIPTFDQKMFKNKLRQLMKNNSLREQMGERGKSSIQRFTVGSTSDFFFSFITQQVLIEDC